MNVQTAKERHKFKHEAALNTFFVPVPLPRLLAGDPNWLGSHENYVD